MNILAMNTWFVTLIKQFFFSLDQVVFNFISEIYNLLISIARTSILTQADIANMTEKIYALLTVFMVFKVTLSLITYVVNPDDFADKSKGLSKLGTNIIISLSLLVLTPYIFSYAFELQTIVLEDNSLAKLIFETKGDDDSGSFINTAGDKIAYTAMSAFFTPNVSIDEFQSCVDLYDEDGFNDNCSGVIKENDTYKPDKGHNNGNTMAAKTDNKGKFKEKDLINYVAGVENKNLGLMFRQDLAVATVEIDGEQEYVMEYKFVFSTVVGVVIILLLLTYCMDIALRSIKLSFLQLIAPIPILSYVDPKSGKDGLFKKWYDMCFKTYLSLFIRLLALYFAIYIIDRVGKMVDIVDGSSVTDIKIQIFVIIGALMFAKQLPKMLEGLGIKLDGDGKFTLNPLKKFEDQTFLGKNITGAAAGAVTGFLGNKGTRRFTGALGGLGRGALEGKGYKETQKRQADVNRKLRQARYDGKTFFGTIGERFGMAYGSETGSEIYERKTKELESSNKFHKANLDYAKGLRTHILSELREKEARELKDNVWRTEQANLNAAESELQAANMSGDSRRITAAREALNAAQNRAFENIMNNAQEDKYMTAEREKYNVRIKNNSQFAEEAGLSVSSGRLTYADSKNIKDNSQKHVNKTDMELYKYSQSSEASQHRGNKNAAEASKIDVHIDGMGK